MIQMDLEDFLEEVKAELFSYEEQELADGMAVQWEKKFCELVQSNGFPKKFVKQVHGRAVVTLMDESELFSLADSYCAAVTNGEESQYWDGLQS